jgi:hypothetical protein
LSVAGRECHVVLLRLACLGVTNALTMLRHAAAVLPADDDQCPAPGERAPEPRNGRVPADVEDQVVAPGAVGEVLPGLVDDVVGAERAHLVQLLSAGDSGALRSA